MFTVSKTFTFCYGHRLLGDIGRCGRLHGHTARATFVLGSEKLDKRGMVIHFDRLKETMGKWIAENLDHTTLLCSDDPLAAALKNIGEPFRKLDWNPTAENLAKMLFDLAKESGFPIIKVELWESETSKATYTKS